MKKLFEWSKNNKLATIIIFILLGYIFLKNGYSRQVSRYMGVNTMTVGSSSDYSMGMMESADSYGNARYGNVEVASPAYNKMIAPGYPAPEYPINNDVSDRMMMTSGNMSLKVDTVNESLDMIKSITKDLGGYVVSVYLSRPEFGESANITVRIPSDKIEDFLAYTRQTAVKVVSENMSGSDITDQYVDVQTRMLQLEEQKAMLEDILRAAKNVDELMKVRPYLTQVQNEIDNLKGREQYLSGAAATSLITINMSTDELSLPYQAENSWRPAVIFKNATRSLMVTLRKIGSAFIWLGVYSVIIIPALTIFFVVITIKRRKNQM